MTDSIRRGTATGVNSIRRATATGVRRRYRYSLHILSTCQSFLNIENPRQLEKEFRNRHGIPQGMRKVCTYHNPNSGYKRWTLVTATGYPVGVVSRIPKERKDVV